MSAADPAGHAIKSQDNKGEEARIMRLAEVEGKALLRRHGVAVPNSLLLAAGEDLPSRAANWPGFVLKAQILEGGRGKAGLVRAFRAAADLRAARRLILANLEEADTPLLLEEAVPIAREIFVAVRIDGTRPEVLIAPQGGENVDEIAKLVRIPIETTDSATPELIRAAIAKLFPADLAIQLSRYAARLPDIVRQEKLELLEINPLALTEDGRLIACNAKIVRQDSADSRLDPQEFPISRALAERALARRPV
jgi:succinyl-CoA synthetase beta subunit